MNVSTVLFRFRVAIIAAIIGLGFWSPWIEKLGIGRRISLTEWLALEISRTGLLLFSAATAAAIVLASLIAACGMVFRIWGTAYLGAATVNHAEMKAGGVMAAGPYRYVRNPLYLGSWCVFAAMAFVMPATGALFAMVTISGLFYWLILGEEAFLSAQLGDAYRAYLQAAPRIVPRLRNRLAQGEAKPHWVRAALSEVNSIGVFLTVAAFSWTFNHWLMVQALLVSFGVSLVTRALLPEAKDQLA